jgi:hypothetical protein
VPNNISDSSTDHCSHFTSLADLPDTYQATGYSTSNYDAIRVFAQAMHNLMADHCPNATGTDARECVGNNNLYSYIINVSVPAGDGDIKFDEQGNVITSYYVVKQYRQDAVSGEYVTVNVGKWFHVNTSLVIDHSLISWTNFDVTTPRNSSNVTQVRIRF